MIGREHFSLSGSKIITWNTCGDRRQMGHLTVTQQTRQSRAPQQMHPQREVCALKTLVFFL